MVPITVPTPRSGSVALSSNNWPNSGGIEARVRRMACRDRSGAVSELQPRTKGALVKTPRAV